MTTAKSIGGGRRFGRRRPLRVFAMAGAALVVASLTAGGLLLTLLAHDGIGSDWLRARLEVALDQRLPPGVEARIGRVTLALRRHSGLVVAAHEVRLRLAGGTEMTADAVTTTADLAALVRGEIDPSLLHIEGTRIVVGELPDAPAGRSRAETIRDVARLLASAADSVDTELRAAGFEDLHIADATILFADPAADWPLSGSFARLLEASWMPLGETRSKFWAQLSADGQPWTLTLERQLLAGDVLALDVSIADLPVSEIVPAVSDPRERPFFAAAAGLRARVEIDADGAFRRMRGRASTGVGYLVLHGDEADIVEAADLVFELAGEGDLARLPRAAIRSGDTVLNLAGEMQLGAPGGPMAVSVALGPGHLAARPGRSPVAVTGGHFLGAFAPASQTLTVESLEVAGPEGEATLAGSLAVSGSGAGLALALSIGEMSAEMARALWPPMAAPGARRWFDAQVGEARIGPGVLQIALPERYLGPESSGLVLPDYALVGQIRFRDAAFSPFGRFPAITGAAGEIGFADATATVILQSGAFDMPAGRLAADGSIFMVPELGRADPVGELTLRLTGPAAALADLSDRPPLAVASGKGIVAAGLSGHADLSLSARMALDADADLGRVAPEFRLMLQGFASQVPVAGRAVAAADLVLQGEPDDYVITGHATIDGIPASIDLRAVAGEEDSAVALTLDRSARERLGIDLDGMLEGVVIAVLEEAEGDGSRPVTLDLTAASLTLPFLGWEKGPGVPARAEFVFRPAGDLIEVSGFSLSGEGFRARGAFSVERETGRLRLLNLSDVSLRPGDSFAVRLTGDGRGYDVTVEGGALDARAFVGELQNASQPGHGAGSRLSLSVSLDRVAAQNGVVLRNVRGQAVLAGGQLRQLGLTGRTEAGDPFDWSVTERDGARRLLLRAADGGAILGGLGIYGRIAGGELALEVTGPAGSSDGTGRFVLNRFQILDEAALADALAPAVARANARSAVHQVGQPAIDTRSMHFSTLHIPFHRQGDIIHIREAYLRGAMLGGTGSGTINLADRRIAISGSLIPVFGINNIAGAIPLIGEILGGGRNEGLVGITYRLLGPVDSPTLHMNPLSAIAPGIFRKIFEYR